VKFVYYFVSSFWSLKDCSYFCSVICFIIIIIIIISWFCLLLLLFTLYNMISFFICSKKNSILLRTQLSVRVHACNGEFITVLNFKVTTVFMSLC